MSEVMLSAADLEEMRAFNDANLPHSAAIEQGTRTFEPGGTAGPITWNPVPLATEPCRISPASVPQEQMTAGSLTSVREFYVTMREGAAVPADSTNTFQRISVTHDRSGAPSPLRLYPIGTPVRSYEMLRKVLCTTTAPQ
jgi:hypothetical protein